VKAVIAGAKYYYLGGFFLTHGVESAKILAQHALDNRKVRSCSLWDDALRKLMKVGRSLP